MEADLPGLTVASLYLPSGEVGTERQDEKERFMAAFLPYLKESASAPRAGGREVLVCGDWNIAHQRGGSEELAGATARTPVSSRRSGMAEPASSTRGGATRTSSAGLHPDTEGPYSWWSYRGRAFDNDTGWRIDLVCSTPGIASTGRQSAGGAGSEQR